MKNNKLTIEELKVDSFATQISEKEMVGIKGGSGYFGSSQQCITDLSKLQNGQISFGESAFAQSNYAYGSFDFQGDGSGNFEIIANDTCHFNILGGGGYSNSFSVNLGRNCN